MNRMTSRIALTSALILAGFAAQAATGDDEGRMNKRPSFEQLDANSDGKVTLEELQGFAQTQMQERFATVDANGDGQLSKDELMAQGTQKAERRADKMIERLDANEDGVLSQAELEEAGKHRRGGADRMEKMFDRADADDDGALTAEEFDEMKGKRGKKGKKGKKHHGHDRGGDQ